MKDANIAHQDTRDTLTEILLGLRLDGVEYGRCVMHEPWAIAFPSRREASFHFIAQGNCWIRTQTTDWMRLNPGDALLLPRGMFHVLASSPEVPTIDIDALARTVVSENLFLLNDDKATHAVVPEDEAAAHILFGGVMRFNLDPLHPLLAMMPDVMRACDLAQRDPAVLVMLEMMEREMALDRIGACGILVTA